MSSASTRAMSHDVKLRCRRCGERCVVQVAERQVSLHVPCPAFCGAECQAAVSWSKGRDAPVLMFRETSELGPDIDDPGTRGRAVIQGDGDRHPPTLMSAAYEFGCHLACQRYRCA